MSTEVGSLHYDLDIKDKKLDDALDASDRKVKGLGDKIGDGFKKIGSDVTKALKVAAVGVGVLAAGVVAFGVKSVKAFSESQDVIAQTNAVIKSTGGVAGVTAEKVSELSSALQQVTKYSDEEIQSAQNLLLTFTRIGKEVFPDATKTILDMSTALGTDLQSSSILVGKALNDPIRGLTALTRVGVTFTEAQREQIKSLVDAGKTMEAQKIILKELQTEFGGSAEAAGKTFSGQLIILKNRLNDVQEGLGQVIVNGATPFMIGFNEAIGKLNFQGIINGLQRTVDSPAWDGLVQRSNNAMLRMVDSINTLIAAFESGGLEGALTMVRSKLEAADFSGAFNRSVQRIDFTALANKILTGIGNINWATHTQALTNAFIGIMTNINYGQIAAAGVGVIIKAVPQIIGGFISGIINTAINRPMDFIQFFLALGFLPGRVIAALGSVLARIPFVGPLFSWMFNAIAGASQMLFAPIRSRFAEIGTRIVGAVKGGLGNVGNVLKDAGMQLINGFIGGITSRIGWVKDTLVNLTKKLTSWKGPAALDKVLLTKSGQMIIDGFVRGLESQYPKVQASLAGLTNNLNGAVLTPMISPAGMAPAAAAGPTSNTYGGVEINIGVVEDRQDAQFIVDRVDENFRNQMRGGSGK